MRPQRTQHGSPGNLGAAVASISDRRPVQLWPSRMCVAVRVYATRLQVSTTSGVGLLSIDRQVRRGRAVKWSSSK